MTPRKHSSGRCRQVLEEKPAENHVKAAACSLREEEVRRPPIRDFTPQKSKCESPYLLRGCEVSLSAAMGCFVVFL